MQTRLKHITTNLLTRGLLAVSLVVGLLSCSVAPAAAHGIDPGFCVPLNNIPVSLAQGQPRNKHVKVTYCQPFNWAKNTPHQVDVLTAGAGYTSEYWNWPVQPATYSYVDKTLSAGRATLAYDRVGSGDSSMPVSTDVTITSDAFVLHQLVQALKFLGYKQVNSVGHSFGSGVAALEASQYQDVSRLVLTGYLHDPSNPAVSLNNYPANQDPKFLGSGLDSGYLTSKPGTRKTSFYNAATADQAVIDHDEATKSVISLTAFQGYLATRTAPAGTNIANSINVPVLAVVGQQDLIFCSNAAVLDCSNTATVRAYVAPFYTSAPKFKAYVAANTAHDVALHPSAGTSFDVINQWIKNPTN